MEGKKTRRDSPGISSQVYSATVGYLTCYIMTLDQPMAWASGSHPDWWFIRNVDSLNTKHRIIVLFEPTFVRSVRVTPSAVYINRMLSLMSTDGNIGVGGAIEVKIES